jgi:hypothetical protein
VCTLSLPLDLFQYCDFINDNETASNLLIQFSSVLTDHVHVYRIDMHRLGSEREYEKASRSGQNASTNNIKASTSASSAAATPIGSSVQPLRWALPPLRDLPRAAATALSVPLRWLPLSPTTPSSSSSNRPSEALLSHPPMASSNFSIW